MIRNVESEATVSEGRVSGSPAAEQIQNSFVDIPLQTAALILPLRDSVGGYRNM